MSMSEDKIDYSQAPSDKPQCDLIMKGGITSGVVYPRAVTRLAERYKLRSIGGTSAGAIAATFTAAACFRARNGDPAGFEILENLPKTLGERVGAQTRLSSLFTPQPQTAPLFGFFMSQIGGKFSFIRLPFSLWRRFLPYALLGALIAISPWLLKGEFLAWPAGARGWTSLGIAILVAFIAGAITAAGGAARQLFARTKRNNYGLCLGTGGTAAAPALTDWLHQEVQSVAGLKEDDPLTVGHLWDTLDPDAPHRDIELVLMTTDITRGIPRRFPFMEGAFGSYYFKQADMEDLFPKAVVGHMITTSPEQRKSGDEIYYRLPKAADLPVIFGMRLSLSFPVLLAAVPLYAKKYRKGQEAPELKRCWFSDGGLISNFPVHFFDSPLPTRPTFAINLAPATAEFAPPDLSELDDDDTVSDENDAALASGQPTAWLPRTNKAGKTIRFNDFEAGGLMGFLSALFDSARNWSDTELMVLPGYRDRIAHVTLDKKEGGLNLDMKPEVIERVAARGRLAADCIIDRFAPPPGAQPTPANSGWENHKWVRVRTLLAGLEKVFSQIHPAWSYTSSGNPVTYDMLLKRPNGGLPSYKWPSNAAQARAQAQTNDLIQTISAWTAAGRAFDNPEGKFTSPRPKPQLRAMPPGDADPRAL